MTAEQMTRADEVMARTYTRFPLVLEKGEGSTLYDSSGRSYLDFVAGIAVCNLGHAHPRLREVLSEQVIESVTLEVVANPAYAAGTEPGPGADEVPAPRSGSFHRVRHPRGE